MFGGKIHGNRTELQLGRGFEVHADRAGQLALQRAPIALEIEIGTEFRRVENLVGEFECRHLHRGRPLLIELRQSRIKSELATAQYALGELQLGNAEPGLDAALPVITRCRNEKVLGQQQFLRGMTVHTSLEVQIKIAEPGSRAFQRPLKVGELVTPRLDRKSTRLNSSH